MTDEKLLELYALKNIIRYNNKPKLKDESVAEHSFFVALIGLSICDEYHFSKDVKYEVLLKAILHDLPETEINDITHDVKYRLGLDNYLMKYENEYFENHFPQYAFMMDRTIDDELSDLILDLADAMSVKQYSLNERNLGNKSGVMNEIFDDAKNRIEILSEKIKRYLEE